MTLSDNAGSYRIKTVILYLPYLNFLLCVWKSLWHSCNSSCNMIVFITMGKRNRGMMLQLWYTSNIIPSLLFSPLLHFFFRPIRMVAYKRSIMPKDLCSHARTYFVYIQDVDKCVELIWASVIKENNLFHFNNWKMAYHCPSCVYTPFVFWSRHQLSKSPEIYWQKSWQ